ncbi:MAG: UDP-N-acetylmuramoyl-L-alanyl-D-glutamate--2,6-diaminopimelate ligase [Eubacteriales bacterium]|nr:UDP-N-acetylmuramoyl-L-alanyl-D-glutamate--2,6-diaminopimelate ligase [bacterium]MDY2791517.1 UDP-N-acetylmuramoyl-L-alanyl-D-glutamate--2,6-diaminopimelate ligase [Eubacteriales bacterium]
MKLCELIQALGGNCQTSGDMNVEIHSLCTDSRKAERGSLFFCIQGLTRDAHEFAPQVVEKGASALIVQRFLELDCPQVLVKDVREALSLIAQCFYGYPARSMRLLGITGTKGKTTTSFLVKSILEAAGMKTGLIGTVCCMIGSTELPSDKTTPDPVEFQSMLRQMADAGCDAVVMEVSAHAMAMHRLSGVYFEVCAFTNLSQDHFDFFHNMENYCAAKMMLFTPGMCGRGFYNADDELVSAAMQSAPVPVTGYGIREAADIYAKNIEVGERGNLFQINFHKRFRIDVQLKLSGIFNVYNSLTAAALCDAVGASPEAIKKGLENIKNVPGRVELLDTGTPYRVILDYAHSPDSLSNILTTVRQTTKKRVILVFGCGGNRDREKRPIMGEIGGRLADYCVLTSDNPRGEEPADILRAIEEGIRPTGADYVVIENRREAIRHALSIAKAGDVVVLAGKGHETYQEIKGIKYPFDEKVVVKELLEEM